MVTPIRKEIMRKTLIEKLDSFKELEEMASKITAQIEKEEPASVNETMYNKVLLMVKYAYISGYVDGATSNEEETT